MADQKISAMTAASSVADADITPIVQGGANKKSAFSVIKTYMKSAFDAIYVPLTRTLTINGTAHDLSVDRSWTVTTATAFTDLTDVPSSYTGQANKIVTVKGTEDGLNFTTPGSAFTPANLTDAGTDGITVTGGSNAVNGSGTSLSQHVADATHNGYLSSTDWGTFNGKQAALSFGNLTDAGTDGITVTGGTGSVIGSGTSIAQQVADASHNGYLSSADWTTFNGHSTVTPAALTKTNDTNVTLTLGGTPATALLQASSLTLGWTGTLAAGRGGTGVSSLGDITKTNDTNVTLTLGGTPTGAVITSTSFALGWTGILASGRGGTGVSSLGDLTAAGTDGIVVTTGTGAVIVNASIAQHVSDASHNGYLSSTDWTTFNGKSTVTPAALTKTDDTNVTLTLGGTPTTALLQASSIAAGWAGTLSQARGGFGKSTASTTDGQIPIGKTSDGSWNVNTITAGAGIAVTNGAGAITIAAVEKRSVTFVVNGSGIVLTSGTKSYVKIPYGGTLQGWLLIGSPSGSITVDIFRSADGAGLPVTSIVGAGVKPSLSSAVENSSTSFTSWTSTTLTAKDNLAIDLSGATNTYLALTLYFQ